MLKQKEEDLEEIIKTEKLKPEATRKFLDECFEAGMLKTNGTAVDDIMPPVRRFGGGNRAGKKQGIIEKLRAFFEKYFGLGIVMKPKEEKVISYDFENAIPVSKVAENISYGEKGETITKR